MITFCYNIENQKTLSDSGLNSSEFPSWQNLPDIKEKKGSVIESIVGVILFAVIVIVIYHLIKSVFDWSTSSLNSSKKQETEDLKQRNDALKNNLETMDDVLKESREEINIFCTKLDLIQEKANLMSLFRSLINEAICKEKNIDYKVGSNSDTYLTKSIQSALESNLNIKINEIIDLTRKACKFYSNAVEIYQRIEAITEVIKTNEIIIANYPNVLSLNESSNKINEVFGALEKLQIVNLLEKKEYSKSSIFFFLRSRQYEKNKILKYLDMLESMICKLQSVQETIFSSFNILSKNSNNIEDNFFKIINHIQLYKRLITQMRLYIIESQSSLPSHPLNVSFNELKSVIFDINAFIKNLNNMYSLRLLDVNQSSNIKKEGIIYNISFNSNFVSPNKEQIIIFFAAFNSAKINYENLAASGINQNQKKVQQFFPTVHNLLFNSKVTNNIKESQKSTIMKSAKEILSGMTEEVQKSFETIITHSNDNDSNDNDLNISYFKSREINLILKELNGNLDKLVAMNFFCNDAEDNRSIELMKQLNIIKEYKKESQNNNNLQMQKALSYKNSDEIAQLVKSNKLCVKEQIIFLFLRKCYQESMYRFLCSSFTGMISISEQCKSENKSIWREVYSFFSRACLDCYKMFKDNQKGFSDILTLSIYQRTENMGNFQSLWKKGIDQSSQDTLKRIMENVGLTSLNNLIISTEKNVETSFDEKNLDLFSNLKTIRSILYLLHSNVSFKINLEKGIILCDKFCDSEYLQLDFYGKKVNMQTQEYNVIELKCVIEAITSNGMIVNLVNKDSLTNSLKTRTKIGKEIPIEEILLYCNKTMVQEYWETLNKVAKFTIKEINKEDALSGNDFLYESQGKKYVINLSLLESYNAEIIKKIINLDFLEEFLPYHFEYLNSSESLFSSYLNENEKNILLLHCESIFIKILFYFYSMDEIQSGSIIDSLTKLPNLPKEENSQIEIKKSSAAINTESIENNMFESIKALLLKPENNLLEKKLDYINSQLNKLNIELENQEKILKSKHKNKSKKLILATILFDLFDCYENYALRNSFDLLFSHKKEIVEEVSENQEELEEEEEEKEEEKD